MIHAWMPKKLHRVVPPAGPRYDIFEIAFLVGFVAIVLYAIPDDTNSAAEAWLTIVGQRVAGVVMATGTLVVIFMTYRDVLMSRAAGLLAVLCVFWAVTLLVGMIASPSPWRPGSLAFMAIYIFLAQWTRKTYDRHVNEQNHPECHYRGHDHTSHGVA